MYPSLNDGLASALNAVALGLQHDVNYLEQSDYSDELKAALRALTGVGGRSEKVDLFTGNDDLTVIEGEIQELLNQVKGMSASFDKLDANEKIQFIKGATALWEKLISLKERTLNLKSMKEFQGRIMEVMQEYLTAEQREKLLANLSGERP
jgi:hypothetical protein